MILIDKRLIYVATPKTATQSIKAAIINSGIPFEEFHDNLAPGENHYHVTLSEMINKWGIKESFCLERDWFERWLSGITYLIYGYLHYDNLQPRFRLEDIDNNFIFETFTEDFVNTLYSPDKDDLRKIQDIFLYNPDKLEHPGRVKVLCSSNFWKSGKKCTYEFNFKNFDKIETFFKESFNCEFEIPNLNEIKSIFKLVNVEINDELKDFVFHRFEKRFHSRVI